MSGQQASPRASEGRKALWRVTAAKGSDKGALAALGAGRPLWSVAHLANTLGSPTHLVLLASQSIAAPIVGALLANTAADCIDLEDLITAPGARRQGVAMALLTGLKEAAEQSGKGIILEVAADNAVAERLYQRAGFSLMGRRAAYYRRGSHYVDALLYGIAAPR